MALGRTVAELEQTLSMREFREWLFYYEIAPFGDLRADLRSGQVAATIASAFRRKGAPAARPIDFMPFAAKRKNKATDPDSMKTLLRSILPGNRSNGESRST